MASKIIMPKLGMAMKDGMIGKWVKANGAPVSRDETVAVIITKKITYELKAPVDGVLHHRVREKQTCLVGAIIGYIAATGESVPELEEIAPLPTEPVAIGVPAPGVAVEAPAAAAAGAFVVATPAARRLAREAGVDLSYIPGSGPGGRVVEEDVRTYREQREKVLITSAARKLAEEYGQDITRIEGSGPGGRIIEADVQRYIALPAAVVAPTEAAPSPLPPAARTIPFTGMRQMIAENMVSSLLTMAQVTMTTEVDVTELVALRQRLKQDFDLTYTDLIVKAAAIALKKHPRLNATLNGEVIQLLDEINIGVGVALEEGLIVPVIRGADQLGLQEIATSLRDLAARARENRLELDEVTGGTFTITNLGAYGIDVFTPIINPPEVAILGVGRIVEKQVIYRGEAARRPMMVLSLTFDHRVVDGVPAAAFLQTLADILMHPYLLGAG